MFLLIKLIKESFIFAVTAIIVNKLRTILSLLGITIGIFAIICVFTVVDSMESKVRNSIASLGDNVLFVQKWPWAFGGDYPWWKYMNRPLPTIKEMETIKKNSRYTDAVTFVMSASKKAEYQNNSMENIQINGISNEYEKVWSIELSEGRFISELEFNSGKNVAVIGSEIAKNLYENLNPIGKSLKTLGRKVEVIGIFKKEGEDSFGGNNDNTIMLPVNFIRNVLDIRSDRVDPTIVVKAKAGVSNEQLKDELTGLMRAIRKLKPLAEDDFAINETSLLTKGFDSLFAIISIAGWLIGGFSIIVGGFGIANIMFVSVRERTNIIGIQKSLGAKNYFILLQFLFESVILCLIGGALGLFLVYLGTLFVSFFLDFNLTLTLSNVLMGLSISAGIGIISGFIPAFVASRLDPVVAIRTN
ncbi:MAG: ABC transporter permease [Bacteroidales bacterium]|nr:ABC transporter permease [Bacteroidales bacterium]